MVVSLIMPLLFCHECGVELPISNQDGVCRDCATVQSESQYTIRALNGGHYGPMPHHRVIEQLERGFHSAEDLVSSGAGDSVPIEEHVDFAAYFIEGDSRSRQLKDTVIQRKRRQGKRYRRATFGKIVKGLAGATVAGAVLWFLPDIAILGQDLISSNSDEGLVTESAATLGEVEPPISRIEILLGQIENRHVFEGGESTGIDGGPRTIESAYEAAWSHLETGLPERGALAVEIMERVLFLSEGEAWALSTLIFAKCATMDESDEALAEIQELISILDEIVESSEGVGDEVLAEAWEPELAYASLALRNGLWYEAAIHSERCLASRPTELGCARLGAEAWLESGDYDRSLELIDLLLSVWPNSTELQLIQARATFGKGDHSRAKDIIERLQGESMGSVASDLELMRLSAAYEIAVGDFSGAIEVYEEMLALGEDSTGFRFRLGRLRLQVKHDYDGAFELLQPLADLSSTGGVDWDDSENLSHVLQASHAARMVGEYELALTYATTVVAEREGWSSAILAEAMALDAMGRVEEAAAAFRRVRAGSLSGQEASRFYLWVANYYNRQQIGRLANNAHDEVGRYDPNSMDLVVSKLQLSLFIGGKASVVNILNEIHLLDLEAYKSANRFVDSWYPASDSGRLAIDVAALFAQDPSMTPVFDRTVGLAGIFDCLKGIDCHRVVHHLNLALERDGTDVAALAGLGRVYYSQQRYSEAARFLQRALGEAGDSPILQSMYGDCLWRIGRQIESEVAFQHSMYMSATEAAPSRRYARALAEWGRLDEAAVFGERALLLDENDTETLRLLVAAGVPVE